MATNQAGSFLGHFPYPRTSPISIPVEHPGVAFGEPFAVPVAFDPSYLDQAYSHGFSRRISYIPFPGHLGVYDYSFEPAFIRKRNERERQRVRCVNEGYARLREHLPQEFEDKRLSKVETLRAAINYIKHLQNLLDLQTSALSKEKSLPPKGLCGSSAPSERKECNSDGESKTSSTSSPYSESDDMT
ncbi:achaete-scute homolog 4-like [Erpetoichthys calabaricus]|uniref:Achaete-scute family bHLH transcription factor 4 n=1 Tax=Erpetoichthys calabaricus TaxID=27687 RepID=A0A8C4RUL3_ERPCA|nr:achaete-scute homolog 4-like [Erpetoichthys calabaricus]